MERRPFRGAGLNGQEGPGRLDEARPDLSRLLADLEVAVPVRHAVSGIVSGPASAIQAAALSDAVRGRDLLAVAPTGSGKTLVFAVGLVHQIAGSPSIPGRPRAIVVSPTRELALQSDEVLGAVGAGAGLRIRGHVSPAGRPEELVGKASGHADHGTAEDPWAGSRRTRGDGPKMFQTERIRT